MNLASFIVQSYTPFVEILIMAIMLNYLLSFFWKTRSKDLVVGLLAFLLILAASSWFKLPILRQIMMLVSNVLFVAIIIIFQPELRTALSKLSMKGKRSKEMSEFDKFLDQLSSSVYRLADKRIGALIVLEHEDLLEEYANKGVLLNACFSSELLETVFATSTPLHDGALIVKDQKIASAAVILPLAEDNPQIPHAMGTRHRAALGMSQETDAVVIVVSEETGRVSIARENMITGGIKPDRLKAILRTIYVPSENEQPVKRRLPWLVWNKK